jgi:molecular chaperone Hsp33
MQINNHLTRGLACKDQFRFFAVNSTGVVQTAQDLHKMSPAPILLLGRMLTAALLMGADIKDNESSLTLNIEANGPLKGAIAVYERVGKVRGYAKKPDYFSEEVKENWQIGKLLGRGTLNIIKDLKLRSPLTGTIELVSGEIAEDIAHYYLRSEQIPTAVSLGVLFDRDGQVRSAGGYLIQQLPQAQPSEAERLMSNLAKTPYITDLLDMGMPWQQILSSIIFKNMDSDITDTYPVEYNCPCNKERFARALRLLGRTELDEMKGGVSPVCHYCNKQYDFSPEDINQIIVSLPKDGDNIE